MTEAPNWRQPKSPDSAPQQNLPPIVERNGQRLAVVMLTDLDGTVNDETALEHQRILTIGPAKEAVRHCESKGIAIGIITARSFREAVMYQNALRTTGPIICEDGAVVGLPLIGMEQEHLKQLDELYRRETYEGRSVLLLSQVTTADIRRFLLATQKAAGGSLISSCTSSAEELQLAARHATVEDARLSQGRLGSAYAVRLEPEQLAFIEENAHENSIRTFTNPVDRITMFFGEDAHKGDAVRTLRRHAPLFFPSNAHVDGLYLIGAGNNTNDVPFLSQADRAIVVRATDGSVAIPQEQIPSHALVTQGSNGHGLKEIIPHVLAELTI